MTKKRKYFYLDEKDEKLLDLKIASQGYSGKGRVERFMEQIIRNPILIIRGDNLKIVIKNNAKH